MDSASALRKRIDANENRSKRPPTKANALQPPQTHEANGKSKRRSKRESKRKRYLADEHERAPASASGHKKKGRPPRADPLVDALQPEPDRASRVHPLLPFE